MHLTVLALQVAPDHPSNRYLLDDLTKTYQWLDEHQDVAEDFIIRMHDKALWLNVDDPMNEPWEWHTADEMFFNVDAPGLKPVKDYLQPYKDLLYVAGVEIIVNPEAPEAATSTAQQKLTELYDGFNQMRVEGKLIDVVYIAEDGQRFPAHRAVLATLSEYLRDLFCGDFAESATDASTAEPIEMELPYSGRCIGAILGVSLFLSDDSSTHYL
jgi:hypothetical protein